MKVQNTVRNAHCNECGSAGQAGNARRDRSPRSCLRSQHTTSPKRSRVRFSTGPPQQLSFSASSSPMEAGTKHPDSKTLLEPRDKFAELCSLLTEEETVRLRGCLKWHELRAGRAVVMKRDVGTSLYFVQQGQLESEGRGSRGKAYKLGAGSCFGEESFVEALPPPGVPQVLVDIGKMLMFRERMAREEDITTLTKAVVLELRSESVEGVMGGNGKAMTFLRNLSRSRAEREE